MKNNDEIRQKVAEFIHALNLPITTREMRDLKREVESIIKSSILESDLPI